MSEKDTLFVLAASYDSVAEAEADYEAVKELYDAVHTSHDFDAAVIARDEEGKVKVVKSTSSRPGTARRRASSGASQSARSRPSSQRSA